MRIAAAISLTALVCVSAIAGTNPQVTYLGGTAPGIEAGTTGTIDVSSLGTLVLRHARGQMEIPYARIDSFEYRQEVTHHLGVLPAIAVGLVKKRQRRHIVRINFHDENNAAFVAILEVPKQLPRTLIPILQSRAPGRCRTQESQTCGGK